MEAVFLDVRKAYRLLHDYQRLILDAVNYMGRQLGLEYVGGWPKFSDRPPTERKQKPDDLTRWAWDWLNFMEYDFHFQQVISETSTIHFSVLLISDSGFYCALDSDCDETETIKFLPAEQSESLLGIVMCHNDWPNPDFMQDRKGMKTFIETRGELPPDLAAAGVVAKCFPLIRLAGESEATQLVDEIVLLAKSHKIPLSRIDSIE
jgi:hypothetical protein